MEFTLFMLYLVGVSKTSHGALIDISIRKGIELFLLAISVYWLHLHVQTKDPIVLVFNLFFIVYTCWLLELGFVYSMVSLNYLNIKYFIALCTPSIPKKPDVYDKIWVKPWEYKSWITLKLLSLKIQKLYEQICFDKKIYNI